MGGEPRKKEPNNCKEWKANLDVWDILNKGKFATYIEKIHGYKPTLQSISSKIGLKIGIPCMRSL